MLLLSAGNGFSQSNWDSHIPTANVDSIYVDSISYYGDTTLGSIALTASDSIGVFYKDQFDTIRIIGKSSASSPIVYYYGRDSSTQTDYPDYGDSIFFKLYIDSYDCEAHNVDLYNAGNSPHNKTFADGQLNLTLKGRIPWLRYDDDRYCQDDSNGVVILIDHGSKYNFSYSGTATMNLDTIFPYLSSPGNHEVWVTSNASRCFHGDTLTFSINPPPYLATTEPIITQDIHCVNQGSVTVDTDDIVGAPPYSFLLRLDMATYEFNFDGLMTNLPPNHYTYHITDDSACSTEYQVIIEALGCKDKFNKNPIISPYSISEEDQGYTISTPGNYMIYNQRGQLVKRIVGPDTWYGKDENGILVETGVYFLIDESGNQVSITVIR